MKKFYSKPPLSDKILLYVEHCLPNNKFKFSHEIMSQTLNDFYKTPHSLKTIRKEFSILKKEGFITHRNRYRKKIPILTRKGKIQIASCLPYKKYDHWDGKWRLCIFSIPEKERPYRLQLQKELKNLGFRKIQDGVYISPYSLFGTLNRITSELGIRQYMTMIESDKIDREKIAVWKIWNIWEINRAYHEFMKLTRSHLIKSSKNKKLWPLRAKQLEREFYGVYQKDPHLPKELLPSDWLGDKAYKLYKELVRSY